MIGYGEEDRHFVLELTYNYGIRAYERGNDFNYVKILSNLAIENIKKRNYPSLLKENNVHEVMDPTGYTYLIAPNEKNGDNSVVGLSLFVTDLNRTADYWLNQLKLTGKLINESSKVEINFDEYNFNLCLQKSEQNTIDHAKAYGRIAFSCPTSELMPLQEQMEAKSLTILKHYTKLDTPGKDSVYVVILADPDGHEICFVGDEGFRKLSELDPNAFALLDDSMKNDQSDEWIKKQIK